MSISKAIGKFLFSFSGFKLEGEIPEEVNRCIMVYAPHTSNWDWLYGILFMMKHGIPTKMAIKDFWTKFPFSLIVKPLGGVGIERIKKSSKTPGKAKPNQVYQLATVFEQFEDIAFIITPEASRSRRERWKIGFYHIAKKANVPIVTFKADYRDRKVCFGPVYDPSKLSLEEVMTSLTEFYKDAVGQDSENFALDSRFTS